MHSRRKGNRRSNTNGLRKSETFEDFYGSHYGERWAALRKALCAPACDRSVLWNKFVKLPFESAMGDVKRVDDALLLQLFSPLGSGEMPPPAIDEFNVKAHYPLDYTTALAVELLGVQQFDLVLDLCAGVGGKSIAISQFLSNSASLTANEQRGDRCARLRRNIKEYVPSNYVPVTVTQRKPETWHDPSTYHRVLVDAPCTGERQLLQHSGKHAVSPLHWSLQACVELSHTQRGLLLRSIETCRPGGRIVYTTCSISPLENDEVVREALKRTRCQVELMHPPVPIGEKTEFGHIVLPDRDNGRGPAYYCVIHKISDKREESEDEDEDGNDDDSTSS
ncbi:NOL1/NOP2/sun family, putative [Trypanosoma equiperdum]|uniref:NOL1/NOP2/Sun domain family member 4 n=2 Tax=Trypanozoon TaxID=39700 RepID=Q381M3_TRYB2|nr:hypothetical protein, conserved [Trypanosoma brucei brucei TREU927]EAN80508.1 hypothetical protein, conserved [Trypanosoma brucei brucei TREU927]SCU70182.1 NOL1/NOP2/sun family, putative [Trypanosoma equiperdum]